MRLETLAIAAAAALGLAGCVHPVAAPVARASSNPTQAGMSQADLDKVVCKQEVLTGSRLNPARYCYTVREWMQITDDARHYTERVQDLPVKHQPGA